MVPAAKMIFVDEASQTQIFQIEAAAAVGVQSRSTN
jgi:hypothetical protein